MFENLFCPRSRGKMMNFNPTSIRRSYSILLKRSHGGRARFQFVLTNSVDHSDLMHKLEARCWSYTWSKAVFGWKGLILHCRDNSKIRDWWMLGQSSCWLKRWRTIIFFHSSLSVGSSDGSMTVAGDVLVEGFICLMEGICGVVLRWASFNWVVWY